MNVFKPYFNVKQVQKTHKALPTSNQVHSVNMTGSGVSLHGDPSPQYPLWWSEGKQHWSCPEWIQYTMAISQYQVSKLQTCGLGSSDLASWDNLLAALSSAVTESNSEWGVDPKAPDVTLWFSLICVIILTDLFNQSNHFVEGSVDKTRFCYV